MPKARTSATLYIMARAALQADDVGAAAQYAQELLDQARGSFCPETATTQGHAILGLVARRQGNLADAKQQLLAAADVRAEGLLDFAQVDLELAGELLAAGERDTVQRYLEAMLPKWKGLRRCGQSWLAQLRAGGTPRFEDQQHCRD